MEGSAEHGDFRKIGIPDSTVESPSRFDVAEVNVSRTWALAGTSIAIFTYLFGFFYPRYASGEIDPILFQIALTVIGFAIFSFVFSGINYYALSLAHSAHRTRQEMLRRRADTLWVVAFSLLLLDPALMLFTVRLVFVGALWLVLWISYIIFNATVFRETQSWLRNAS